MYNTCQKIIFATTVLSVYIAPTEEKDNNEEDDCYENLDQIYEECLKRDVKIIIGDLNFYPANVENWVSS
jgi:hypothetical protein